MRILHVQIALENRSLHVVLVECFQPTQHTSPKKAFTVRLKGAETMREMLHQQHYITDIYWMFSYLTFSGCQLLCAVGCRAFASSLSLPPVEDLHWNNANRTHIWGMETKAIKVCRCSS